MTMRWMEQHWSGSCTSQAAAWLPHSLSISQHTMFFQNPKTRHIRAKAYVCPNTGKLSHRSACQCQCHCASCSAGAIAGAVLVPVPDTSGNELHMLLCIQVPIPTR